jgi:hypothetical protein
MHGYCVQEVIDGGSRKALFVPGILSRSVEQVAPLSPVLKKRGLTTYGLDYAGSRFDADTCAVDLAEAFEVYRPEVVIALSLGGMISSKAVSLLGTAAQRAEWHIVDSPSCGQDLVLPLPTRLNPAIGWLSRRFTPNNRANDGYGKWLLDKMVVPPKLEAIEVPALLSPYHLYEREDDSARAYRRHIQWVARRNLSGHSFTTWYEQLRWMLAQESLPLELFSQLPNVTYYSCTKGNVTVRQPQAGNAWNPYVKRHLLVPTAHAALLEASVTWNLTFDQTLS